MSIGLQIISDADWRAFMELMNDAHESFNQKIIKWYRVGATINRYQEDLMDPQNYSVIELKVLLNDNWRRSWPINIVTDSGIDDEQTIQVYINRNYLKSLGYINDNGNFIMSGYDYFIIDGYKYVAFGDTHSSPMNNGDEVFITILIKKVEIDTANNA